MDQSDQDALREVAERLGETPLGEELGLGEEEILAGVALGERALKAGRADEAMQVAARLVLLDPRLAEPQILLTRAALRAGRFEIALQSAAQIIGMHPRRPEGYLLSGHACLGLGEPGPAREDFESALERAGGDEAVASAARQGLLRAGDG